MDQLLKSIADLNESIANLQGSFDEFKTDVAKKFAFAQEQRLDNKKSLTARVATIGNQLSYFRQTVCNTVKDGVIIFNFDIS